MAVLRVHVAMLDQEQREFGPDYEDHGLLFCWEDGTAPHPDTITRRFKRLSAAAGLPEIDLHGIRHNYATAGRDAKIDWKALSQRIGHADVPREPPCTNPCKNGKQKAPSMIGRGLWPW